MATWGWPNRSTVSATSAEIAGSELNANIEKVKVLVLGDSGVGKSSAIHLICNGRPSRSSLASTIGCNVEVKLHEYKQGTNLQKVFFVEFWEIGGNTGHANARRVFYNGVNGIILVHDLTNSKSHDNLRIWLADAVSCRATHGGSLQSCSKPTSLEFDAEMFADVQVPVLVIGTKAPKNGKRLNLNIADLCGAEHILLDATAGDVASSGLSPGSSNALKLSHFFDKVIEKRFYASKSVQINLLGSFGDRRRATSSSKYFHHLD